MRLNLQLVHPPKTGCDFQLFHKNIEAFRREFSVACQLTYLQRHLSATSQATWRNSAHDENRRTFLNIFKFHIFYG